MVCLNLEPPPTKAAFTSLFNTIALERHRLDVWKDFVTSSAIALHNAVAMTESLENEYLEIILGYDDQDKQSLCELFSLLVQLLDTAPVDILGQLYMELGLASKENGQYFTPSSVCELMAEFTAGDNLRSTSQYDFVTLHDPACGSGGMILAFTRKLIRMGRNPADHLWVQCIDVNRVAALMAYIQLSLWNIPAEIVVGNTLSLKFKEHWYTPAHYRNGWESKLRLKKTCEKLKELSQTKEVMVEEREEKPNPETPDNTPQKALSDAQVQFDFRL